MSEKQETTTDRDDPLGSEPEAEAVRQPPAAVGPKASEGVDAEKKRLADYRKERELVRQRLERQWRCTILEAEDLPFDWYFIRNDTVAAVASYAQHPESGNVLLEAGPWHWLRMWSTALRVSHFWVVDFFAQGLRYKMYPPMSGIDYEVLAKDGKVWVSLPQNDFDILKEEA